MSELGPVGQSVSRWNIDGIPLRCEACGHVVDVSTLDSIGYCSTGCFTLTDDQKQRLIDAARCGVCGSPRGTVWEDA